ncbi:MAG: hypothetical protein ACJAWX_002171, partial [Algoriphagus sp.]
MNSRTVRILQFLLVFVLVVSCKSNESAFSKKDVKSSQKLIGLEFSDQAIDTMYDYLVGNKLAYDSLRLFKTSKETFPAMMFDPHPLGFQFPEKKENP